MRLRSQVRKVSLVIMNVIALDVFAIVGNILSLMLSNPIDWSGWMTIQSHKVSL